MSVLNLETFVRGFSNEILKYDWRDMKTLD